MVKTIKTNKASKLKKAGLVALIAGSMTIGGIVHNQYSNSDAAQIKKEISNMSEKQLKDAIKDCDVVLKKLQKTIESDSVGVEDRIAAQDTYNAIIQERAMLQKSLEKVMRRQPKTLDLSTMKRTR